MFGSLGAKLNRTVWLKYFHTILYLFCVGFIVCVVFVFCSSKPRCIWADLSGPLFDLNVRLSPPSSPGARSGGSGSVVLRADLESVNAISCRCAPHSGVGNALLHKMLWALLAC